MTTTITKESYKKGQEDLRKFIEQCDIDINGHNLILEYLKEDLIKDMLLLWMMHNCNNAELTKEELISKGWKKIAYQKCNTCGKKVYFDMLPKGKIIRAQKRCRYPRGYPVIKTYLKIPSGEILFDNNLREYFPKKHKNRISINYTHGVALESKAYARSGMAYHFTGNSSPSIIKLDNEHLQIGNGLDGKKVGSICTDLWWYCAVDRKDFEIKSGKKAKEYKKEYGVTIVKVRPGLYETTGLYHRIPKWDEESKDEPEELLSTLTWIGEL